MPSNRRPGRWIASLVVALLATAAIGPTSNAGPISDMLARHRQAKMAKLPPVTPPHKVVPMKDPNARTASLTQRFKQRWALRHSPLKSARQDQSVIKTSR